MKPQQQPQYKYKDDTSQGDSFNVDRGFMDADFSKHIINVNPLLDALYMSLCGHRKVIEEYEQEFYGKKYVKTREVEKIDRFSRFMNESGANYIYHSVLPMIAPVSSTSHVKPIDIYNYWSGHLLTLETALLDSYFFETFFCNTCYYITADKNRARDHFKTERHKFEKVINPFELNIERYANVITQLAIMSMITMKAKEGFTMKEIAESYMNFNTNRQMQMMQPPQGQGGILGGLRSSMGMR